MDSRPGLAGMTDKFNIVRVVDIWNTNQGGCPELADLVKECGSLHIDKSASGPRQ